MIFSSSVAEMKKRGGQEEEVVTSSGRFAGRFSREETYAPEALPRENIPVNLTENVSDFTGIDGITPIHPLS